MKILIVETGGLGDFISALPSTKLVRQHFVDATITVTVPAWFASFARSCKYIDQVIDMPSHLSASGIVRLVRKEKYDIAINFHPARKNTIGVLLARATTKFGYFVVKSSEHFSYRDNRFARLSIKAITTGKTKAGVSLYDRALAIAKLVTRQPLLTLTSTYLGESDPEKVKATLPVTSDKYVVLHPFSSKPTKNWLSHRISAFIDQVYATYGFPVVILGGEKDRQLIADILEEKTNKCMFLAPPMDTLVGIIAGSFFFVGVDSGPLHVAVGTGTPAVGLFGRTSPTLAFPDIIPHAYCHFIFKNYLCPCSYNNCTNGGKCMDEISAEEVMIAIARLLDDMPSGNPTKYAAAPLTNQLNK